MANKFNSDTLLAAASSAAGMIKTLAAALKPQRKSWPEKAKDAVHINRKVLLGTLAGGIIGATTALLLAPGPKKKNSELGKRKKNSELGIRNSEKKGKKKQVTRKRAKKEVSL